MAFKIRTKEELRLVMETHDIPCIHLTDMGNDMGILWADMKYEGGKFKYMNDSYAVMCAIIMFNNGIAK